MSEAKQTPANEVKVGMNLDGIKNPVPITDDIKPENKLPQAAMDKAPAYFPELHLDQLIKYYKEAGEKYVDVIAHLETAKFKISNIK